MMEVCEWEGDRKGTGSVAKLHFKTTWADVSLLHATLFEFLYRILLNNEKTRFTPSLKPDVFS